MPLFHHILFPVDFSDSCQAIYPLVKGMADKFGAKVSLLHAVNMPAGAYGSFASTYPIVIDLPSLQQDAQQQLAAFAGAEGEEFEKVVPVGDPAYRITDYAAEHDVDLIMMPTRGYGKFRRLLLGSLTAKVLHDAQCAVWTAAHTDDPTLPTHAKCESIVCALDLGRESLCVLQRAVELARLFQAKLQLIHAVPAAKPDPMARVGSLGGVPDDDYRYHLLNAARAQMADLQAQAGTNLQAAVEGDSIGKLLRRVATKTQADLVVIGRGRCHETFGRLRTHEYSIIRESPCPVLSF